MRAAVFGWIMICCVIPHESGCTHHSGNHPAINVGQNSKLAHTTKFERKGRAKRPPNSQSHRKNVDITNLKKRRSLSSFSELSCCDSKKSTSKKDVVVINPQKIHYAKKIIVGKQFRKLLRALYQDHPKASQAINGKFQLSDSNGVDISEAGKNKTLKELRSAILSLLEKLKEKTNASQNTEHKNEKQEVVKKFAAGNNLTKTAETKIQENAGGNEITSVNDNEISAKRANYLDLLNFISRMKTMEGVRDIDPFHQHMMHGLKGMEMNGLNGIPNPSEMLSNPMNAMYDQGQNELLPGNGIPMQEMNLGQQRKIIEDQMENQLSQLQTKFKLLEQQQQDTPNLAPGLQYPIATPPASSDPLGLTGTPFLNQEPLLYDTTPYLPFRRPHHTFRTHLPYSRPMVHDEDPGEEIEDGEIYDDRDEEGPPRHYHVPEDDEPGDNYSDYDEEARDGPDDDEK